MSKKNRNSWNQQNRDRQGAVVSPPASSIAAISEAQLVANAENAQLSTGPRTEAGLAKSSKNALKSALTGRTVLLPADDVEEYARFLADFQKELQPVGQQEKELVQIIVDCHWRLRRIQELEYAIYLRGERQFAESFQDESPACRRSMILLETHLAYQKELRNLHIQESRIDRKRRQALAELQQLQSARLKDKEASPEESMPEAEYFKLLDAGYIPPSIAARLAAKPAEDENGFVFANAAA